MVYLRILLSIQVALALSLIAGYQTKLSSVLSWYLYLGLTLRNTWLNFILDRYFHYLLFLAIFLPLDGAISLGKVSRTTHNQKHPPGGSESFVTPATIALKVLVVWIYWDAGYGKYSDPLGGWTFNAQPLPALDTYVRHTVGARYLYGLLGPIGLRYMTPTVVYAEMFTAPLALFGSLVGKKSVVYGAVGLICTMHIGIAFTMRNTVLLGLVACCAWCVFLPEGVGDDFGMPTSRSIEKVHLNSSKSKSLIKRHGVSALLIGAFVSGSIWFETLSNQCDQSQEHIWSTLLHNRWNVFVGAEEYVTWEIAPGRLADGTIVDVWSKSNEVSWEMPGAGAPCTSTSRAGRWRSFPYLAGLEGEEGEILWQYLCSQWDFENNVSEVGNEGRQLMRFNFFMLQADILPNMGFSVTRKRLIHSHDCMSSSNFGQNDVPKGTFDFGSQEEL